MSELRRKLSQGAPYDEVLHTSEVDRLKRELRSLRQTFGSGRRRLNETEARPAAAQPLLRAVHRSALVRVGWQEKLLESSLESVEELSKQLRQRQHECEQLHHELAEQGSRSHAVFAQGASAASQMASELTDELGERVHELMRDFQHKSMQLSRQAPRRPLAPSHAARRGRLTRLRARRRTPTSS